MTPLFLELQSFDASLRMTAVNEFYLQTTSAKASGDIASKRQRVHMLVGHEHAVFGVLRIVVVLHDSRVCGEVRVLESRRLLDTGKSRLV